MNEARSTRWLSGDSSLNKVYFAFLVGKKLNLHTLQLLLHNIDFYTDFMVIYSSHEAQTKRFR